MGFFDKLKEVFTGGGGGSSADSGIYLYIRLNRTGEIVRLRLDPQYELVPDYDQEGGSYRTHKSVVGPRTFDRAEAVFYFDATRRLKNADIEGGVLVEQADFDAQEAARQQPPEDAAD